jgi:hypothetical protein
MSHDFRGCSDGLEMVGRSFSGRWLVGWFLMTVDYRRNIVAICRTRKRNNEAMGEMSGRYNP